MDLYSSDSKFQNISETTSTEDSWSRYFDHGSSIILYDCIQTTGGDGYLFIGGTDAIGAGGYDVLLMQTDADGNSIRERTFGGSGNEFALDIEPTSDGNYLLTGTTDSYGIGGDLYVVKVTPTGDMMWENTYGRSGNEKGYDAIETGGGDFLIVGWTTSAEDDDKDTYILCINSCGSTIFERTSGREGTDYISTIHATPDGGFILSGRSSESFEGYEDAYLIKLDAEKEIEWNRSFGGEYNDHGRDVLPVDDGYIVVGWMGTDWTGNEDLYIVRTDLDGSVRWEKTIEDGKAYEIFPAADGGYVLGGYGRRSTSKKAILWHISENGNLIQEESYTECNSFGGMTDTTDGKYLLCGREGNVDSFILKASEEGSAEWCKNYGVSPGQSGEAVMETPDGYMIAGEAADSIHIIHTDMEGNMTWERTVGNLFTWEGARSIAPGSDTTVMITGHTNATPNGDFDIFLMNVSLDGEILGETRYGGQGDESGQSVLKLSDGGYLIAGTTTTGSGQPNILVIRTDANGTERWSRHYGGETDCRGYSACIHREGGYLITGTGESDDASDQSVYLMHIDEEGDVVWNRTAGIGCGNSIKPAVPSGYAIVGHSDGRGKYILIDEAGSSVRESMGLLNSSFNDISYRSDGSYVITGRETTDFSGGGTIWEMSTSGSTLMKHFFRSSSGSSTGSAVQCTNDDGYIVTGVCGDTILIRGPPRP
ncbi:hypothetical protein CUJ86_10910 [Methanofollis fontis]|uniref:Uncharacterized protein n=1 Tax=Methanofollis fontis TaxID=2052832 RepID=A0A483CQZ6_9EURY|nr:hypothetical protein CUJ86_10910 [Methanofollis fontis]